MAESSNSAGPAAQANPTTKPPNPVWRMLGMPNFRLRLPSRNWMIFLTITGSFTAALVYDRREKRHAQQKWCDLVAHLSRDTLPVEQTRRKVTVYLAAPPGDGLRVARDHFKEYVKPILVAAALDYQVVEGRRQGDIRAALAERTRKLRRHAGEPSTAADETPTTEDVIADARSRIGVTEEPGPKGDLVIGRHTWKEYIRGLHEGWLGPLDAPQPPAAPVEELTPETPSTTSPDGAPATEETPEKKTDATDEKKDEKPAKPAGPTPAYITPAEYSSRGLPPSLPSSLDGSVPVPFPHILGFLNTPIRMYRYLNQRVLADRVGREVAGIVLASQARPYADGSSTADSELAVGGGFDAGPSPVSSADGLSSGNYEQQSVLEEEEREWHKVVHKKDEADPEKERVWVNEVVLDPRIASRMQRYVLSYDEEERSRRIGQGSEYILGEERPAPVPFWKRMWIKYGYGEDEETLKRKPIIGNIDEDI
ncbi:mitochondrial import inner membrane translocase subunit Tim54 [Aspergillus ambiguus]|uniref:Tim22-complex subunit TIM54 n=1 Tax=Aspergillus ambiguus TaxID=176160 RepID=UPI003CCDFB88